MNERIKKLYKEAMVTVPENPGNKSFTYLDPEKFARLIIRECAQVCRDQPNEYAFELDRENCASAIEEHFGVEE